jgi:putative ABC transport system permease protein
MLRNYFKVALRNLTSNKLYSFLNIGGLAVGISVCMLIMVYVAYDWSFDRFHKNAGRIFYPGTDMSILDDESFYDGMSYKSGPILKSADPGIESFLRVDDITQVRVFENVAVPEKKFTERKLVLADSNFFTFFSFPLLKGDPGTALSRPFTMVITQAAAQKYFGDADPIGRSLRYDGKYLFEVTGVAANPPSNSTIDFDFVGSSASAGSMHEADDDSTNATIGHGRFVTYLLLRDAGHTGALTRLMAAMTKNSHAKFAPFDYSLRALVHLHNDRDTPTNVKYRKIFPVVAGLILLLALINYMSLATARSAIRAKEIGVRKILGADRGNIVKQFYIESGMYGLISFLLALLLFGALRPMFYRLLRVQINETFLRSPYVVIIFGVLLVLTVAVSGSYPSLVLSSFKPVKVLYGRLGKQKVSEFIRRLFTVLQFTISVALIICSIVINRQIYYFRHMDTGMNREQVLMIPYQKEMSTHHLTFKRAVANVPGVTDVAVAVAPVFGGLDMTAASPRGSSFHQIMFEMYVDESFIPMLGLRWKIPPADSLLPEHKGQVIMNEEAVKKMRPGSRPIGQGIILGRDSMQVCGVVKDFNYRSLHEKIAPLCLSVVNESDSSWVADYGGCLYVKIGVHANIPTLLTAIRSVYNGLDKTTPFQYQFLDDAFDAQYKAEDRLSNVFNVFTGLTIFIACLGLFGLASFSAAQRTREIGIRKVLGATVTDIVSILSADFVRLVVLAILIASPVAWYFMRGWLEDFAYRIPFSWWIYAIAGACAVGVALLTVSYQAFRAATANPVESLRTEG